jgi:hypothetical protein
MQADFGQSKHMKKQNKHIQMDTHGIVPSVAT